MSQESELLQLIALVYEAAQNSAVWPEFLEGYARTLGAAITVIQQHRFDQRTSEIITTFGMSSRFKASYNEHYSQINVWRNQGRALYRQGRVLVDEELCSREMLKKSEFYNEYLLPMSGVFSASGVIGATRDAALMITALRTPQQRAWSDSDTRIIQLLLPHVTRAWDVHDRLRLLTAGASVLDNLDIGIAFVRAPAGLVYANRVAEQIFERADGFSVRDGALRACDASNDARLRQAIRDTTAAVPSLACQASIAIERRSVRRPYQVVVAPLVQAVPAFSGMPSPHAMLVIVDPEHRRAVSADALTRLYGLTPREAALASALSISTTVEVAAGQLGMTYETARSHLRRIFEKSGTSRQAELVVLLARLPTRQNRAART